MIRGDLGAGKAKGNWKDPFIDCLADAKTMIDRFFRLGGIEIGPARSPMRIEPKWLGKGGQPAPAPGFAITSISGCDVTPIDLSDPVEALRLKAYVWPDAPERMARIDAAIALAAQSPPLLVRRDAGDFVEEGLAKPQADGTTRTIFHSIMWQYLPEKTQASIRCSIESAGSEATRARQIAWVSLVTDPATFRHELSVRHWDGQSHTGERRALAFAHPHGAWVERFADR